METTHEMWGAHAKLTTWATRVRVMIRENVTCEVCCSHKPASNEIILPILWNCEKLTPVSCTSNLVARRRSPWWTIASCTSNLWEKMFDFPRHIRFTLILIMNLQGLQQNLSLEIDPNLQCWAVLPTWQYCRQLFVWINIRNQTSKAFVASSCPFWDWSGKFVYGPKNVRSTNSCLPQAFLRPLENTRWTFLQPLPTPPAWSCDHLNKELRLCTIALSFLSVPNLIVGPRNRLCVKFLTSW